MRYMGIREDYISPDCSQKDQANKVNSRWSIIRYWGIREHYISTDCFLKDKANMVASYNHLNCQIPLHSHDFLEINIITAGSGKHHIEEMSLNVTPGDVFIIPVHARHGYTCKDKLNVHHILICKDFITRYQEELEAIPGFQTLFNIEPQLRQATPNKYFLHLDHKKLQATLQDLDRITAAYNNEQFMYQNILTLHLICDLCMMFHEQMNRPSDSASIPGPNRAIIQVLEYIQGNLDRKLTVDELSRVAAMSCATFNRHFKQMLGIPPMEYVVKCRVQRALILIDENRLSKTEIALMCGFYDSSHMDKYIKLYRNADFKKSADPLPSL